MNTMRTFLPAAFAVALAAGPAAAHDVWLTLPSGASVPQIHLHYGHQDDIQLPQLEKVVEMQAVGADGRRSTVTSLKPSTSAQVLISEPLPGARSAMISARYDNGFWVKDREGTYRNTTRRMLSDATDAVTSVKFAKLVAGPGAPWSTVVGHELEIVPLQDPLAAKPGETLNVRVLFRGQAVAGAKVVYGDGETVVPQERMPSVVTDGAGVAAVPVERSGSGVLTVARRVAPSSLPALADADTFSATLAYAVEGPRTN